MEILDNEFDVVEEQIAKETPAVIHEEELPEKYRGKSAADIARMHQEAEKLISRQGQEVSEVRRLADELLKNNLRAAQQPQPKAEAPLDDVDFFADPKNAIAKAVASHPAVLSAQNTAVKLAQQDSLRTLKETHPDYTEIIKDDSFKEWVGKSKIRSQLFMQADRNYDFEAANELLTTYKELRSKKEAESQQQVQEIRESQERSLKAASNPAVGGSSEPVGKKIYRRADLIRLRMYQPDRYEALESEIMQAYAEGRVR
jgi:ElaB/YqjD/DUF883 family membrane-anchored ribosome-binding protein